MIVIVALQQTQEDILSHPKAQQMTSAIEFHHRRERAVEEGVSSSENA